MVPIDAMAVGLGYGNRRIDDRWRQETFKGRLVSRRHAT